MYDIVFTFEVFHVPIGSLKRAKTGEVDEPLDNKKDDNKWMYRFGVIYAFQKKECHQFEKYEISNERIGKMSVGSGEFYIGSTISPVARWKRYQDEIKSMRPRSIRSVTKYIFQNGGIKNFNFIILEDFPCESTWIS